ncbi:MAG: GntR family transcriptional regulator [Bacteroidales bacterium]|nr:GntR family transcriptional regulator [Bacteroidales bacterium]
MEFKNNQAIYIQIADYMCEHVLLGKWKEGERIPSVREIAVDLEVNPNTVMRTFNYLQEKEIIYNKRGIGYFVTDKGYNKALEYKRSEFLKSDIPLFFKNLNLLNMDIKEVIKIYNETNKI